MFSFVQIYFMMLAAQVKQQVPEAAEGASRKKEKPAFQFYSLKTNRLEQIGLYRGDQLLVEYSTELLAGHIILIEMDGKLLLRRLEQANHAWILIPLQQKLASLEWPLHIPLPLVGIVRQIIRQF
jgi:SOS-response transcriptional repressor LexA